MLELDGSEGGGQLFRSALTLSALTGRPIEMDAVRGSRPEPGLRPQHLTVLQTLAAVCDATVEGDELGATTVTFDPGDPSGGRYDASIGTAGSVTLLFDALIPLAWALDEPLQVTVSGGTSVTWSPSMPWYRRVKLPLLRRAGVQAAVDLIRPGFYPTGGGQARLSLAPSRLARFEFLERGERKRVLVHSTATPDLADAEVAERQAEQASDSLEEAGIEATESTARYVVAKSTGTVLLVALEYETGTVGADALGEPGKPAEEVADDAVAAVIAADRSAAPVDAHLADQLIPWLALAGGRVTIPEVTDHVQSHCDLIEAFGYEVRIESRDDLPVLVGDPPEES